MPFTAQFYFVAQLSILFLLLKSTVKMDLSGKERHQLLCSRAPPTIQCYSTKEQGRGNHSGLGSEHRSQYQLCGFE